MDITQFWQLIEESKQASGGDTSAQLEFLTNALGEKTPDDILDFYHLLNQQSDRAYTSHLWAAAFIALGGCSDDWFDYFRGWLVAQGRKTFDAALASPESLLEPMRAAFDAGGEPVSEEMLYLAVIAYEQKTGKEDFWEQLGARHGKSSPRPEIEFDWDESEESLEALLPGLFAAFW